MVHISLPENKERRLVFYLAMEEYGASLFSAGRPRPERCIFLLAGQADRHFRTESGDGSRSEYALLQGT